MYRQVPKNWLLLLAYLKHETVKSHPNQTALFPAAYEYKGIIRVNMYTIHESEHSIIASNKTNGFAIENYWNTER